LNVAGNIRDAVLLAAVSALKDVSLPMAQYDAEQENLTIDKDRKCQLTLSCMPVSLSFTVSYKHVNTQNIVCYICV